MSIISTLRNWFRPSSSSNLARHPDPNPEMVAAAIEAIASTNAVVKKPTSITGSVGAGFLRSALAGATAGAWASDHREETRRNKHFTYISVHAMMQQYASAIITVYADGDESKSRNQSIRKSIRSEQGSYLKWAKSRSKSYKPDQQHGKPLGSDHPLVRLLERPNPYEPGSMFRMRQAQQIRLTGTCLIWNVPNRAGRTCERYVIPTAAATPVAPTTRFPRGAYIIQPTCSRYVPPNDQGFVEGSPSWQRLIGHYVDAREIQKVVLPHALWLDDGQSPISACDEWIDGETAINISRTASVKNGLDPSFIYHLPEHMRPEQDELDDIQLRIQQKYGGPTNVGRVIVGHSGGKIERLSNPPKEMCYTEGFQDIKASVLAVHQTPPIAVGLQEAGAYAAYNASAKQWRYSATQPLCDLFAESDSFHLAPQFGEGLTVDIESPSIHDEDIKLREDQLIATSGAFKVDELRERLGYEPLGGEDGDKLLGGQQQPQAGAAGMPGAGATKGSGEGGDDDGGDSGNGQPKNPLSSNGSNGHTNGFSHRSDATKPWNPSARNGDGEGPFKRDTATLKTLRAAMEGADEADFEQLFQKLSTRFNRLLNPDPDNEPLGSTQINLPEWLAGKVRAYAARIPDDELAEDGREDEPHATILYGLTILDPLIVKAAAGDFGPIDIALGKVSIFPANEGQVARGGAQYDVVKIEVISDGLHKLHDQLKVIPHVSTFPDYQPHITIAYLKPGCGEKYVGDDDFVGHTFTSDSFVFSSKNRERCDIPLTRSKPNLLDDCSPGLMKILSDTIKKDLERNFKSDLGMSLDSGAAGGFLVNPDRVQCPRCHSLDVHHVRAIGHNAECHECGHRFIDQEYGRDGNRSKIKGWITLKPHGDEEGGYVHVFIDGSGKITAGPKEMEGKHVSELSKTHQADVSPHSHPEADAASHKAQQMTERANTTGGKKEQRLLDDHHDAADAHSRASTIHRRAGNEAAASHHERMADEHRKRIGQILHGDETTPVESHMETKPVNKPVTPTIEQKPADNPLSPDVGETPNPPTASKPEKTFPTADEAIKRGMSLGEWQNDISRSFVNEEIDDDHPAWQAIQAGKSPTPDQWNRAKNLYGKHVVTQTGFRGKVTDISGNGSVLHVTDQNGKTALAAPETTDKIASHLNYRGEKDKDQRAEDLNYIAPIIAKEAIEQNENIGKVMDAHGIDNHRAQRVLRPVVANELEKQREFQQKQKEQQQAESQSDAQKRAIERQRSAQDAEDTKPSDKPESPAVDRKMPWEQSADEYANSGASAFRTEKGSVYSHNDGKTIRIKTEHVGHDKGDHGLKNESTETHYVSPEGAQEIGMWNTLQADGKRIIKRGDELWLTSINPKTGRRGLDGKIKIESADPKVGLAPVELFEKSSQGDDWYKGNHPGNKISEMVEPAQAHELFVDSAKDKGAAVPASVDTTNTHDDKPVEVIGPKSTEKPIDESKLPKTEPRSDGTIPDMEPIQKGETPAQAAARQQKVYDVDYEYARPSSVQNVGKDIKGSARHKANEWRGLAAAEEDGSAERMLKRDVLMKVEPHDLMEAADDNPVNALAMHYAMRAFPPKPGYGNEKRRAGQSKEIQEKNRQQYLDTYREYKDKVQELARQNIPHQDALKNLGGWLKDKINDLRGVDPKHRNSYMGSVTGSDRANDTANSLVDTLNALHTGHGHNKNGPFANTNSFLTLAKEKYGTLPDNETLASHVKDVIEGESVPSTFGKSAEGRANKYFDPADVYIDSKAERLGGRDVSHIVADPNNATQKIKNAFGASAVQFGTSMTDPERAHHAQQLVAALSDLADVTGLKPVDLGFNDQLGWALGARGHGKALAHYEPEAGETGDDHVINMTRKKGVGAMAHEWGHAFDHATQNFTRKGETYGSRLLDRERAVRNPDGTVKLDEKRRMVTEKLHEDPVWQGFDAVRKAWKDSGFQYRLNTVIRDMQKEGKLSKNAEKYWASKHEMFARSFEKFVKHKLESQGRKNTYLSGIAEHPLWPNAEEIAKMAPAFEQLFAGYRQKHYGSPDPHTVSESEFKSAISRLIRSGPVLKSHWVTLHPHGEGTTGVRVELSDSGEITKGPHALTGKHISELSAEHRRATHLIPHAHEYLSQQHEAWEKAKADARKVTGLTAGKIAKHENAYRDHSTIEGFDTSARTAASQNPELGVDPEDHDAPAKIWEIIREGARKKPSINSKEVRELAADWAKGPRHTVASSGYEHDDDWKSGTCTGSTLKSHDVSGEARDDHGRWTEGGAIGGEFPETKRERKYDQHGRLIHPTTGQVQARRGGEVSEVDGQYYRGGHWMPVHGLTPKVDKTKKRIGEGPAGGSEANEQKEPAKRTYVEPRVMSPEEIEAKRVRMEERQKWNNVKDGPIGDLLNLGDQPGRVFSTGGNKQWTQFAEKIGPEALREFADKIENETLAAVRADAEKTPVRRGFNSTDGFFTPDEVVELTKENWGFQHDTIRQYMTKKAIKQFPDLPRAMAAIDDWIEAYGGFEGVCDLNDWVQPHSNAAQAKSYNPSEQRDPNGKWTGSGSGSGGEMTHGNSPDANDEKLAGARDLSQQFNGILSKYRNYPTTIDSDGKVVDHTGYELTDKDLESLKLLDDEIDRAKAVLTAGGRTTDAKILGIVDNDGDWQPNLNTESILDAGEELSKVNDFLKSHGIDDKATLRRTGHDYEASVNLDDLKNHFDDVRDVNGRLQDMGLNPAVKVMLDAKGRIADPYDLDELDSMLDDYHKAKDEEDKADIRSGIIEHLTPK